jgi:hypothetical protein
VGAEHPRLLVGALRQLPTTDTIRDTQLIPDP